MSDPALTFVSLIGMLGILITLVSGLFRVRNHRPPAEFNDRRWCEYAQRTFGDYSRDVTRK